MKSAHQYFILVILFGHGVAAQSYNDQDITQSSYERKSISVINKVFYGSSWKTLTKQQEEYFIGELKKRIELDRFDFNILPDKLVADLSTNSRYRNRMGIIELRNELEKSVMPSIVRILDYQKEMRAQNLITERQRNSFLAIKARSAGITSNQLIRIMNSAFIYIPYIDQYLEKEEGGLFVAQISGGIIEYRISYDDNAAALQYLKTELNESKGRVNEFGNINLIDGKNVAPREYAFRSAVKNLFENLHVNVRRTDAFTLVSPITEVDGSTVRLSMGKNNGVMVDDAFEVYEDSENTASAMSTTRKGFVRVTQVDATSSTAKIVFSDGISRGMSLKEFPARGVEMDYSLTVAPYSFSSEPMYGPNEEIRFDASASNAYLIGFTAAYQGGKSIGWSQFFTFFDLHIGFLKHPVHYKKSASQWDGQDFLVLSFDLGLMKKYYYRRISFAGGYRIGFHVLSHTSSDPQSGTDYELTKSYVGSTLFANIEMVLDPTTSIGVGAGYRYFPESNLWNAKMGSDEFKIQGALVQYGTPFVQFYLHKVYTSMLFDPWEWLRGKVGVKVSR